MTTFNVAVENSQVFPRPHNSDVSNRLNLYGEYNDTFYERWEPGTNNNRTVPQPRKHALMFNVLGSNPLNGAIARNPAVVKHELEQTLNRDPENVALGAVPESIPQVGRDYRNQLMSLPQHVPEKVYKPNNAEFLRAAQSQQTRRV